MRLLEVALAVAEDPAWLEASPDPEALRHGDDGVLLALGAPLLHGATLRPDPRRLHLLVQELLRVGAEASEPGASLAGAGVRDLDATALVRAAVLAETAEVERMANATGADPGALHVVSQLASLPLLHACATRLRGIVPEPWAAGYCPVCGAWPTLAELRGLDRSRHLRCGRCAADWPIDVLHCPFCDEVRHDRLGSLIPEAAEPTRRVDVCKTCKGYVKTLMTLRSLALRPLLMEDVATVEFDIAAHDRGYARPERPGYPLRITIERGQVYDRPVAGADGHRAPDAGAQRPAPEPTTLDE